MAERQRIGIVTEVTKFMTSEDALILEERYSSVESNRGDIGYIQVGGLPDSLRTRFVMTNPDLELDNFSVQAEHCGQFCGLSNHFLG